MVDINYVHYNCAHYLIAMDPYYKAVRILQTSSPNYQW